MSIVKQSDVSPEDRVEFIKLEFDTPINNPIITNLFGARSVQKLTDSGITSICQIYGIFMTFKSKECTMEQWHEKICEFLISVGVTNNRKTAIIDLMCDVLTMRIPNIVDDGDDADDENSSSDETI
jgi:hypothetical protein